MNAEPSVSQSSCSPTSEVRRYVTPPTQTVITRQAPQTIDAAGKTTVCEPCNHAAPKLLQIPITSHGQYTACSVVALIQINDGDVDTRDCLNQAAEYVGSMLSFQGSGSAALVG
jgi:hypothetical protein